MWGALSHRLNGESRFTDRAPQASGKRLSELGRREGIRAFAQRRTGADSINRLSKWKMFP